jgi:Right handed beta helix region
MIHKYQIVLKKLKNSQKGQEEKMKKGLLLFLSLTICLVLIGTTHYVPADFLTIQEAIDAATNNDEIRIETGTYYENLIVDGKNLNIRNNSSAEADSVIIDGGQNGPVIQIINSTGNVILYNLVIRNGRSYDLDNLLVAGGVHIENCSSTITLWRLIVENNSGLNSGGISIINSENNIILQSEIRYNYGVESEANGCGIMISESSSWVSLAMSNIHHNSALCGGGIYLRNGANLSINDSFIYENFARWEGGGIRALNPGNFSMSDTEVTNNTTNSRGGGIWIHNNLYGNSFSNCKISNNTAPNGGGGIWGYNAYIHLTHSEVNNNTSNDSDDGKGGGVYLEGNSSFRSTDTDFLNNTSYVDGGGIYIEESEVNIYLSNFKHNASQRGGGINLEYCEPFQIKNCIVDSNSVSNLGAGIRITHCNEEGDIENGKITDTQISNNTSTSSGGGIDIRLSNCELLNSKISENQGSVGGGIYISESEVDIFECQINGNTALYSGGGIHLFAFDQINIQESLIYQNVSPGNGAGIESYGRIDSTGLLKINNCLIRDNHITDDGKGGGIYTIFSETRITSSNVINNFSDGREVGEGIYSHANSDLILANNILWGNDLISHPGTDGSLIIRNSDIENYTILSGSEDISGVINQNPLFANPEDNDYYLTENSPCIDTGINAFSWNGEIIVDLSPEEYHGTNVDMGYYEYSFQQLDTPVINMHFNNDDVILNWNFINGATSYNIYRSTDPSNFEDVYDNTSQLYWTDYDALTTNKYFYRVTATNH